MYVVTNREVDSSASGLAQFGGRPNERGPNELRLAEVRPHGKGWRVEILDDRLEQSVARRLIAEYELDLDPDATYYASLKVACAVAEAARCDRSHVLFFVHGYNNDMQDVVRRAHDLERRFKVKVVAFSWPANGGGVSGTASYKSDKRDARVSTGALERTLGKMHTYFVLITEARRQRFFDEASERHPDNPEARDLLYSRLLEKDCPFTVNALFHSMGCYLLKQMLKSSIADGTGLLFDNVVLAAADTNNQAHRQWVERIRFRNRCFITINENDFALKASRIKAGSEQLARLGHYLRNLDADNAHYVNVTDAAWIRNSHTYFGDPATRNDSLKSFFTRVFRGESPEDRLRYHPEGNWFGL